MIIVCFVAATPMCTAGGFSMSMVLSCVGDTL